MIIFSCFFAYLVIFYWMPNIVNFMLFGTTFFLFLLIPFSCSWDAIKLLGKNLILLKLVYNLCKVESGKINKNKIEHSSLPKRKEIFSFSCVLEYFLEKPSIMNPSFVPLYVCKSFQRLNKLPASLITQIFFFLKVWEPFFEM